MNFMLKIHPCLILEMSTIVMLTLPCEILFPIIIGRFIDDKPLLPLVCLYCCTPLFSYTFISGQQHTD